RIGVRYRMLDEPRAKEKGGMMSLHWKWGRLALAAALALVAGLVRAPLAGAETVTITFANWAAAEGTTKPALRVRAGNPPDVAQLAGNDTFLIAATGKLEPLSGYIDTKFNAELKPDALSGLAYQGKLIALPWTLAPAGLWYDKAILQKAGLDPEKPP